MKKCGIVWGVIEASVWLESTTTVTFSGVHMWCLWYPLSAQDQSICIQAWHNICPGINFQKQIFFLPLRSLITVLFFCKCRMVFLVCKKDMPTRPWKSNWCRSYPLRSGGGRCPVASKGLRVNGMYWLWKSGKCGSPYHCKINLFTLFTSMV